jgi:L-threonylcarbamoyladenylate synthase
MKIFSWPLDKRDTADFADTISNGGIAIIPTDTVYGIAAAPGNASALAKIVAAKGRDPSKPCQLLAASTEAAAGAVVMTPPALAVAKAFWPGALTLVLPAPGGGTEGVRVPDSPAAIALCTACGGLLRCTSANRSGEKPALTVEEAIAALPGADVAVDAGAAPGGIASSVAAIRSGGEIEILREGPVSHEALERAAAARLKDA